MEGFEEVLENYGREHPVIFPSVTPNASEDSSSVR